jgi:hypothetical protein
MSGTPSPRVLLPTDQATARNVRQRRGLAITQSHINVLALARLGSA